MTHEGSIHRHQRLLETYRALLRAYIEQQTLWQPSEVPELVSTGINTLRAQIAQVKTALRDIGAEVDDLTIDQPSPKQLQQLKHELERQRERLSELLLRQAMFGRMHTPSSVTEQIKLARTNIHRIKAALSYLGTPTQDFPHDAEL